MLGGILTIHYIAIVLEILLYGAYVALFAGTVWVITHRRTVQRDALSPVITVCSWLLFVCLTIHIWRTISIQFTSLVTLSTDPTAANAYLMGSSSVPSILRSTTCAISSVAIDVMLVFRLWIVWGRSWAVAAALTITLLVSSGVWVIFVYINAHKPTGYSAQKKD